MIRGLYTAASGMLVRETEQEVVANNLSNADTVGFRKDETIFHSFPEMILSRIESAPETPHRGRQSYPAGRLGTGVREDEVATIHAPGRYRRTDRSLDLALQGDGFFVVETAGGLRLTRSGNFTLDDGGQLTTMRGNPVLGLDASDEGMEQAFLDIEGHEVAYFLSEGVGADLGPVHIAEGGLESGVVVDREGRVFAGEELIAGLVIIDPGQVDMLAKEGGVLFRLPDADTFPLDLQTGGAIVEQGMLEGSNVDIVDGMVRMISANRAYEANQRVIQAHDEALARAVQDVGDV